MCCDGGRGAGVAQPGVTPRGRSTGPRNCRTSAPYRYADARRSPSPRRRIRSGMSTVRRQRTVAWSAGRKPHRFSAQALPVATATRDVAHGSHNPVLHRAPQPSGRQSPRRRTGIANATIPRRSSRARRDRRRRDQRHRGLAERAIEAAKGGGCVFSREVNGGATFCSQV